MAQPAVAADPFGGKHVLIIGIDGCRTDSLQAAKAPNIKALIAEGTVCWKVYSGGELGTKTEQITISGPSWGSILAGVWVDKHNIRDNEFENTNLKKVVDGKITGYPHFFTRIKDKYPDCLLASIVNWQPINDKIVTDADHMDGGNDAEVTKKTADLLLSGVNPAVIFVHLDEVDGAGHSQTYGPQSPGYMQAIETADAQVGDMVAAMRKRPNYAREDWLVLVTADHGGKGKNHGDQTPEERTVFIIAAGGGYPHKVLNKPLSITAVPPTVFRHLGIPVDPAWGWESAPFTAD